MDLSLTDTHLTPDEMSEGEQDLASYTERLADVAASGNYVEKESSIVLPADDELGNRVVQIADTYGESVKYVFVIGIGGSNLGTKAVYDALYGYREQYGACIHPRVFFIDTISPTMISEVQRFIRDNVQNASEVVVNIISKSGGTTETIVNAEFVVSTLSDALGKEVLERVVVTTDEGSKLHKKANELGIDVLFIPETVGGRYSVLSPVGLFPLALAGVDISDLRQGALDAREICLQQGFDDNPAIQSATAIFQAMKHGVVISDTFLFHPELESLGKWYRQLVGESLGKEEDRDGNPTEYGITPTVSIGSTDLHSVAQLYLGGPNDKITTFIRTARSATETDAVAENSVFSSLVNESQGRTAGEIMDAIYEGVKLAYRKRERRFMELELEDVSAYTIGEFFQFKMMETMYLGELLNINAFNQPHVELYKKETKRILEETKE